MKKKKKMGRIMKNLMAKEIMNICKTSNMKKSTGITRFARFCCTPITPSPVFRTSVGFVSWTTGDVYAAALIASFFRWYLCMLNPQEIIEISSSKP